MTQDWLPSQSTDEDLLKRLNPKESPPISAARPIFVLGSVRSGTSVLVNGLRKGAGIPGFNEGNVAPLMQQILDVIDQFFTNFDDSYLEMTDHHQIGRVDPKALQTLVINYFIDLFARDLGEGIWVDKSPESYTTAPMVRSAPLLLKIFPNAKFIFCARRGIENVMSRMKKFPETPFGHHCRSWAAAIQEWGAVREVLGEDICLTIYQRDIAIRPEEVSRSIQYFLGFSEEQYEGLMRVFTGRRYEQTQVASEHKELALSETPWNEGMRGVFIRWCQPMMEAAGFSLEGQSFESKDVSVRLFFPTVEGAVERRNCSDKFGFVMIDDDTFQLHPNAPGAAVAEVRYLDIPLDGHNEWKTEVRVANDESAPVRFHLGVQEAETNAVVYRTSKVVEPGEFVRWSESLSPLEGRYVIALSTEMADPKSPSSSAWAQFRSPQFRKINAS